MSVPEVAARVATWNGLKSAWIVVPTPAPMFNVAPAPPPALFDAPDDEAQPARAAPPRIIAVVTATAPDREVLPTCRIIGLQTHMD